MMGHACVQKFRKIILLFSSCFIWSFFMETEIFINFDPVCIASRSQVLVVNVRDFTATFS